MANFSIYIEGATTPTNYAGWSLVLTNGKCREVSHYMGAVRDCSQRRALYIALKHAFELIIDHGHAHAFRISIPDESIFEAVEKNEHRGDPDIGAEELAELARLRSYCAHITLEPKENKSDAWKTAKVMAENAYKFGVFGYTAENERRKVAVTEMRGN
jgi:hypothetical protein